MERSCTECRQIVSDDDSEECICFTCGGIFHAPCIRSKRRSKNWNCSRCSGKKQEKGLLVTEAVNQLIHDDEFSDKEWWIELETPSRPFYDELTSSDESNEDFDIWSNDRKNQSRSNSFDTIVDSNPNALDIDSNGVCTHCGLISIPKVHILQCSTCKKTKAHTLCMKRKYTKNWTCPSCPQLRKNANYPKDAIQVLARNLPESMVVLCDECHGEFSMPHMRMTKLPKGNWYCQHCSAASRIVVSDNDDYETQVSSPAYRLSPRKRRRMEALPPTKKQLKGAKKPRYNEILIAHGRKLSKSANCSRCDCNRDQKCRECRRISKAQNDTQRVRVPLRVAIPEPATEIFTENAAIDLWALHDLVGRTLLVFLTATGQWLCGRVAFFDPHSILHQVQFLDDSEQWLPLHRMSFAFSELINVFVKLRSSESSWWPAQLMSLSECAREHIKEKSSEKLVYLFGGENVCSWVSMSSVRCFDIFEEDANQQTNPTWNEAIEEAKEEAHLAREAIADAKETLRRDIQKRLQGKKWIGKRVEVMNFVENAMTHGTILEFNPLTKEYYLNSYDSPSRWFSLNDDVHMSLLVDCTYSELSMRWFTDPDAVLCAQDKLLASTSPPETDLTRCVKCLFPLTGDVLIPCNACSKLFHRSCVDCPQEAYPLQDKDGNILVDDINPPFLCPDCLVCDGCMVRTSDRWHRWKMPLSPITLCSTCDVQYREQSYCPVCHKIFGSTMHVCCNAIQCTNCDLWVHSDCEPDPDPIYHSEDSTLDYLVGSMEEINKNEAGEEELSEKQRRRLQDEKLARSLSFTNSYDPRVMAKYECFTCRRVRCFKTLKALISEDKLLLFREPVTLDIAPTYFDVIKNPMDLKTMENYLKSQQYINALCGDFRDHFELMCLNAVTFNSKERDFPIWREAWRFYNAGLRLLRQLMPSTLVVPGKYSDSMIAAAKRQLPNNSVLANKEEPKREEDVPIVPTDGKTTMNEVKDESNVLVVERVVESVTHKTTSFVVPTELGIVPKPYSCLTTVVAMQSKAQAHEMSWLDMCLVCCSSGQTQSMIFCVDCGEAFHNFCLQPPLDFDERASRSDKIKEYWRCPNCKICEFCGRCNQEDESRLLVCDVCERGFHTFCLKPKLREVPSGGFVCGSCVHCESCSIEQEATTWSPCSTLCITCMGIDETYFSKKKIKRLTDCCPVCSKKWLASEPLIQCDGCELWVHPMCDSVSEEMLESLAEDHTSEYYCPQCRQKQRKHLNLYAKAWDLQQNITSIQDKRQEIIELWHEKQMNEKTSRQWSYWKDFTPIYLYTMRLGEDYLKTLAGRRISFMMSPPGAMVPSNLIPLNIRHRASRYLRFKRYARGPKAAQRRQHRKKEQFFTWENIQLKESAISNVVSEAVSAASFLACCVWMYGMKKLSRFPTELLRVCGEEISETLVTCLIDENALPLMDEVRFIESEYNSRIKTSKESLPPVIESVVETPVPPSPKDLYLPPEKQAYLTKVESLHGWDEWEHLSHLGNFEDHRLCGFCRGAGDSPVCGRLIYTDYDQWIHVNCVLWSNEVYEDAYGTILMCQKARFRGRNTRCTSCTLTGATISCHGIRCPLNYHFNCALDQLDFTIEKQMYCHQNDHWMTHVRKLIKKQKTEELNEMKRIEDSIDEINESTDQDVHIDTTDDSIIESCITEMIDIISTESIDPKFEPLRFLMSDLALDKKATKIQMVKGTCYRIGSLSVQKLGTIQVGNDSFHTRTTIYPVGYRSTRIYWSYKSLEKRCLYENEIVIEIHPTTRTKRPLFKITPCDDMENPIYGNSPNDAMNQLRSRVLALYESNHVFSMGWNPFLNRTSWYSYGLLGDHFFGLTIPIIGAAIETLPNSATTALMDSKNPYPYVFCHHLPTSTMFEDAKIDIGRSRIENEHAKHSSGCARTDGTMWQKLKHKPDVTRKRKVNVSKQANDEPNSANKPNNVGMEHLPIPMQYRELRRRPFSERLEVRKSKIHGYGLFVKEPIAEGKMIVEYQGQAIRQKVADMREKRYEEMGIGSCYMFRMDKDIIVDATRTGNLARFINHSCDPKANARIINIDGNEKKIIIFAKKKLNIGDEVTYDYKFPIEDEAIRCDCGTPNCIGRMN